MVMGIRRRQGRNKLEQFMTNNYTTCYSPYSRYLAVGGSDYKVAIYDLWSGMEIQTVKTEAAVWSVDGCSGCGAIGCEAERISMAFSGGGVGGLTCGGVSGVGVAGGGVGTVPLQKLGFGFECWEQTVFLIQSNCIRSRQ